MRGTVAAVLCLGSSALIPKPTQRFSPQSVQAVPSSDAAKPLAALAPAAQLATALTLATITIGAPEVACASSV